MNKVLCVFSLSVMITALLLVFSPDLDLAKASTTVNGIISQDTTWTRAGSPYTFTGAVGVAEGVILTVEAGVTVDLGSYYLEVNGTLNAEGTDSDKIVFNASSQTNANQNIRLVNDNPTCKIENAVLNQVSIAGQSSISNATLTLNNCSLLGGSSVNLWGSTTISDSYVSGAVMLRGDSTLTDSTFLGGIDVAGSCSGSTYIGTYTITDNDITNTQDAIVLNAGNTGTISGNSIWGGKVGICQADGFPTISATIQNNLITNNQIGIFTRSENDDSTIKDNTISGNQIGISQPTAHQTITGNNFNNNSQYNMQAGASALSAAGNWWGTTDRTAIDKSIYDANDDFHLGTIVYVPFLTSANPNTADETTQPTTTPTPTNIDSVNYQSGGKTSMETLNGIEIGVFAAVAVIAVLLAAILISRHRKHLKPPMINSYKTG